VERQIQRMLPYECLAAWRRSHELVLAVYQMTAPWPKQEMYGLVSQARRAAFSIPANIAEGSAKRGSKEFRRYLDISLGSLSELAYCLHLARDLNYIDIKQWEHADSLRSHAHLLTWRLYSAVSKRAVVDGNGR
jgi:four helix bundle protein